jgi:hypothetical protein
MTTEQIQGRLGDDEPETPRVRWILASGSLGPVEALAREYYLNERGFRCGILKTDCLYGSIVWVLFHELIFHNNLHCVQPLRPAYRHDAQRFCEEHRDEIETKLDTYRRGRLGTFNEQYPRMCNHKLFTDPRTRVHQWCGSWVREHTDEVRQYLSSSPDHDQERLLWETLSTARNGLNEGWPDLVVWRPDDLLFVEVKGPGDVLSPAQRDWLAQHDGAYRTELLRVVAA